AELDASTQMYYYGARYYDPRISIFVSLDPLAEQTMEPYLYTGNNPIMFTDPTGMSKSGIDGIIIRESANNTNVKGAIETFASTEEGRAFLSNFAKKGDVVGDHTFTEDGEYHKQGLDLIFSSEWKRSDVRGSTKKPTVVNGRGQIEIVMNNNPLVASQDDNYYNLLSPMRELHSAQSQETYNRGILSRALTVMHEAFIHAEMSAQDFIGDHMFDNSNIDPLVKARYRSNPHHWQHRQLREGNNKDNLLFNRKGLKASKQINQQLNFGRYYSDSQLQDMMWDFVGGR
ncbi:MAG: RHS repeat-associated core domain-containing protein, partial [Flavobacterium nitrogenifigens]|uniref:RHS repeat-associated core domain-containing protein n=1 Tax=Flavobacterium nitrogenifigens TaxID=1617283 RepID=UPI0028080E5F